MKNNLFKGSILVGLGASSYGMLAAFVKLAYQQGFTTAEVTLSQYSMGFAGLLIITLLRKPVPIPEIKAPAIKAY
jgi:hypothetical protein